MQVLLVEDDNRVAAALRGILGRHGFTVTRADSIESAWAQVHQGIDLVLLDLMLPDGDGLSLCARIRTELDLPILITTARGELVWRLHGLNLGADDYLVKPYDVRELIARMHALVRRSHPHETPRETEQGDGAARHADLERVVADGRLRLDLNLRRAVVNGRSVRLTRKEFALLDELTIEPGLVVRREQLLSRIWHSTYDADGRTLNVHISKLRAKLGDPSLIETVRGAGYRVPHGDPP